MQVSNYLTLLELKMFFITVFDLQENFGNFRDSAYFSCVNLSKRPSKSI